MTVEFNNTTARDQQKFPQPGGRPLGESAMHGNPAYTEEPGRQLPIGTARSLRPAAASLYLDRRLCHLPEVVRCPGPHVIPSRSENPATDQRSSIQDMP